MNTPINNTEHAAAVEAGRASVVAKDRITEWNGLPVIVHGAGIVQLAKETLDAHEARAAAPRRRTGSYFFTELESYQQWLTRFKQAETVVFADIKSVSLTAIINAHPAGNDAAKAGWGDFRASYTCPRSPEWIFWTGIEGKPLTQDQFADIIDSRLPDLTGGRGYPEPMAILEMARNLMIQIGGQYKRTIDPITGTGTLIHATEHGADSTKIHRSFCLALRVFEGGEQYSVEARIRFDLDGGRPKFRIELHRRAELERDAFLAVRKAVHEACKVPVFAGSV